MALRQRRLSFAAASDEAMQDEEQSTLVRKTSSSARHRKRAVLSRSVSTPACASFFASPGALSPMTRKRTAELRRLAEEKELEEEKEEPERKRRRAASGDVCDPAADAEDDEAEDEESPHSESTSQDDGAVLARAQTEPVGVHRERDSDGEGEAKEEEEGEEDDDDKDADEDGEGDEEEEQDEDEADEDEAMESDGGVDDDGEERTPKKMFAALVRRCRSEPIPVVDHDPPVPLTEEQIVEAIRLRAEAIEANSFTRLEHLMHHSWLPHLACEWDKPYFVELKQFLVEQEEKRVKIFPKAADLFSAFEHCPFEDVRVVILGQDPYHDDHQAHGLCFSVRRGVKVPPSLRNIFTELKSDIRGFKVPQHGHLKGWAKQGVLMLNATLTVQAHKPASHAKSGWQTFTDAVIDVINRRKRGVVFILWGDHAQKKGQSLNEDHHLIIRSAHPSPLSAYRGFFGSKPFSKTNNFLKRIGSPPVDWKKLNIK